MQAGAHPSARSLERSFHTPDLPVCSDHHVLGSGHSPWLAGAETQPLRGVSVLLGVPPAADLRQGLQGKQFGWEVTPDGTSRGAGLSQGKAGGQPECTEERAPQGPWETGGHTRALQAARMRLLAYPPPTVRWLRTLPAAAAVAPGPCGTCQSEGVPGGTP